MEQREIDYTNAKDAMYIDYGIKMSVEIHVNYTEYSYIAALYDDTSAL